MRLTTGTKLGGYEIGGQFPAPGIDVRIERSDLGIQGADLALDAFTLRSE